MSWAGARRWGLRLMAGALVLLVLAAFLCWRFARSGMPWREGVRRISGLEAPVTVRFDTHGVPQVEASSLADLAFAIGFLHANDRMLQLELGRRAGAGRLAEVLGSSMVEFDTRLRRLGLRRAAERSVAEIGPAGGLLLDRYAAGVNAWLDERGSDLPPLVRLLGSRPEPWTPADSMTFVGLMAMQLEPPGSAEERRMRVLRGIGPLGLSDLLDGEAVEIGPALEAWLAAESASPATSVAVEPPRGGSNAIAVGPERSISGAPLLAGDPHLGLGLPAQWFLCGLHAPEYEAVGATLPGLPIVVIGTGPTRAWSFTNTGLDSSDLFLERWATEGETLERADGPLPVTTRHETIRVRFGDAVELDVHSSDIGPLLPAGKGLPLRSLRFAGAAPCDPFPFFLALANEPDSAALDGPLETFLAPAQNLLFAQSDGEIGRRVVGRVPERTSHWGRLPVGAQESTWDGFRPARLNPRSEGGGRGFEINANNDVGASGSSLPFVAEFADPSRALELERGLEAAGELDRAGLEALQQRRASDFGVRLREAVLAQGEALGTRAAEALELLRGWDGAYDDSPGAALALCLAFELRERLFADERRRIGAEFVGDRASEALILRVLSDEAQMDWFDRPDTEERELLEELLEQALVAGIERCEQAFGGQPREAWDPAGLQAWELDHALVRLPVLGPLLSRGPLPTAGHWSTPYAVWGRWENSRRTAFGGASLRFSVDLSDLDAASWQLPGGQSGHPLDEHYDDLLLPWSRGLSFRLPFHAPAREALQTRRLRLEPAD